MIYTAPIAQITWDDIDVFCQQRRTEDSYLDYKKDFPDSLDKTIAAMANTVGGIILIGIEEDNESKPQLPILGVAATKGLQERVTNIILSNILPPVFPEIQVYLNESSDRAIILIRIQQSEQAPHAIAKNTRVYLRTGNVSKPEDLAQVDQIDWLRNRRQKSENLRMSLFARAQARAARRDKPFKCPMLTMAISPMYPTKPLIDPPGLHDLRRKIAVQFQGRIVPEPNYKGGVFAHESLLIEDTDKPYSPYTEMSVFGLYFTQDSLQNEPTEENDPQNRMYLADIFVGLYLWLISGEKLYSHLGYWGPVWFCFQLSELHTSKMKGLQGFRMDDRMCRDPEIRIEEVLPNLPSGEDRINFWIHITKTVSWAFGWDFAEGALNGYYEKLNKGLMIL